MGKWKWEGFSKEGKKIKGTQEAQDEKELRKLLRAQGVRPIRYTPPSIFETDLGMLMVEKGLATPFGKVELMNFTRQLSIMINAGVPILQALEICFKQEKNPSLKSTLKRIANDVGGGSTLSESMAKYKGFDRLYCNLVKAGEAGGILDTILKKLAIYMEKQDKIKGEIKGALTYPTIVSIVGGAVIYIMLLFVVPKFTEMLKDGGQEIPAITQFVIDVSNFLQDYTKFIVPAVFVLFVLFSKWTKSKEGKPVWDRFIIKVPLFGDLIIKGNLSSFSRTLSTLLSSGVALVDSLEICGETVDNLVISTDIAKVRKQITEGKTLAEPLGRIKYFPEMVAQMIRVGEATGNIDEMLLKVADLFEDEVDKVIGTMSKMIEPLILVVLGGIIAVLLVAMYMPIFMSAGGSG